MVYLMASQPYQERRQLCH